MPALYVNERPTEILLLQEPPKTATGSSRLLELDILRGFLLFWMTLTHLPTALSHYSNQAVGFVSAAEGFIFLAAFLIGHVHRRAEIKRGASAALRSLLSRAFRIYRYHFGLLAVAFTFGAGSAIYLGSLALQNQLDYFLAYPHAALGEALVLLYNPPLLDILPMYILFMLATPLALKIAKKWGWGILLAISGAIWVWAQFGLRNWVYTLLPHVGITVPLAEAGAFDLFGWQFLWMIGLALGTEGYVQKISAARIPKWLFYSSAATGVVFLILRHSPMDAWTGPELYGFLIDKWHLGILRLVNFAVVSVLLVRFGAYLVKLPLISKFSLLGQSSLEVFSAHIVFCLIGLAISREADAILPWWQSAILLPVTFVSLFTIAHLTKRRKQEATG